MTINTIQELIDLLTLIKVELEEGEALRRKIDRLHEENTELHRELETLRAAPFMEILQRGGSVYDRR